MLRRTKILVFAFPLLLTFLVGTSSAFAEGDSRHLVRRLTDGSSVEQELRISGAKVVWLSNADGGEDNEIYFFDGTLIRKLSDNAVWEHPPQISGSNVVWSSEADEDEDIYLFDGEFVTNLSENEADAKDPRISGSRVVWSSDLDGDFDIYLYDGQSITNVSNSDGPNDVFPRVSESHIAWYRVEDQTLHLYDGEETRQLASIGYFFNSDIFGSSVVWNDNEEGYLYNGSDVLPLGPMDFYSPQIWEDNLVWGTGWPDSEIYFSDGGDPEKIAGDEFSSLEAPKISGSNVVWSGEIGEVEDIHFYDGTSVINLSDHPGRDQHPAISGANVAWHRSGEEAGVYVAWWLGPDAVLENVDLEGEDLSNLDLRRAAFAGANVANTDFSGTDLSEATGLDTASGSALYDDETAFTDFDPEEALWTYVPEPAAALLAGAALSTLAVLRRRSACSAARAS